MEGGGGGGGGRRASSASDFFTRRHSSAFFQSMRRYSTNTVFGLTNKAGVEEGGEAKPGSESKNGGKGGRRHSAAVGGGGLLKSGSSSPRSDKWRSLARVVLGNVDEGGEVRQEETGDKNRNRCQLERCQIFQKRPGRKKQMTKTGAADPF